MSFHPNLFIASYRWNNYEKNFLSKFWIFSFFNYFYLKFYVHFLTIKRLKIYVGRLYPFCLFEKLLISVYTPKDTQIFMFKRPISRQPPSFCPHRRKNTFFSELLSFKENFCILGQQVLTKIFTWQKSPNFILQNSSFDFFISYVVPEIFQFLGSSTRCPDFEITTFIFKIFSKFQKSETSNLL